MLNENLLNLLEKECVTLEELQEIEEDQQVKEVENCGSSGRYPGKVWYNIVTIDEQEFSLYTE